MAEPPTLPDAVRASNSMPLCLGTMSADEWRCAAPARAFGGPWALNRQQPEGGACPIVQPRVRGSQRRDACM